MSWHTSWYPGLLAKLLSSDRDVVDDVMKVLKRDVEAFEALGKETSKELKDMYKESIMNSTFMLSIALIARRADWKATEEVIEHASAVFRGNMQSVINENANKEGRDRELRDNKSKTGAFWTLYGMLRNSKLVSKFGREEVLPFSYLPQEEVSVKDEKKLFDYQVQEAADAVLAQQAEQGAVGIPAPQDSQVKDKELINLEAKLSVSHSTPFLPPDKLASHLSHPTL
jgi:hypothetical protein